MKEEISDEKSIEIDNDDIIISMMINELEEENIFNMTENTELESEHDLWI